MRSRLVSVIGGAQASPEDTSLAERIGNLIAGAGFSIVCGGGSGVMEAVCRGVASAGGLSVGLIQGTDPAEANEHVTIVLATGMGSSRNRIVAISGEAVVAVGGGYGTLSEIAFALQAGRPVCAIGRWASVDGVVPVDSPEEALDFVLRTTGGDRCLQPAR